MCSKRTSGIIADFARLLGVPTPTLDAAAPLYGEAEREGYADQDVAAVHALLARRAGLKSEGKCLVSHKSPAEPDGGFCYNGADGPKSKYAKRLRSEKNIRRQTTSYLDTEVYVKTPRRRGWMIWRPVPAVREADGAFRLCRPGGYDPETETCAVSPDTRVKCRMKVFSDGKRGLVAVAEAGGWMMLTDAQRAAYEHDGFIIVPDVFSAAGGRRTACGNRGIRSCQSAEIAANDAIYDLEDTHSAAEPRVRRIKSPHAHHDAYFRASRHPAVVAILAELWGSVRYTGHRQAEPEICRLRRADRMAPGLGVLPAHQ